MGLLKLWNLADDEISKPYLILPHGYGITKGNKLPVGAKQVLKRTVELMRAFPFAKCLIFNSEYFWKPKEFEEELKKEYMSTLTDAYRWIDFNERGINSTVEEVAFACELYDLQDKEVVSVCDRIHARRVRYIWKKITRDLQLDVKFKIVCVDGIWGKEMPSKWQQSNMMWLAANIIGCVAYAIMGVKRAGKVKHKVQ